MHSHSTRPAGPTNGIPLRSSTSPGCSPTRINRGRRLPLPNTACVVSMYNGHAVHACTALARSLTARESGTKTEASPLRSAERSSRSARAELDRAISDSRFVGGLGDGCGAVHDLAVAQPERALVPRTRDARLPARPLERALVEWAAGMRAPIAQRIDLCPVPGEQDRDVVDVDAPRLVGGELAVGKRRRPVGRRIFEERVVDTDAAHQRQVAAEVSAE